MRAHGRHGCIEAEFRYFPKQELTLLESFQTILASWPQSCYFPAMFGKEWERIPSGHYIFFGAGFAGFVALLLASEPGFIPIIDHANLLFHEAGHPLIGFFIRSLEPYGGTIGQLTFPVILAITGWRRGKLLLLSGALVWFFENFLNIARYMADARKLQLPLVGGGDHDWNTILAAWDILMYDTRIANVLRIVGWIGIMAPVLMVVAHACLGFARERSTSIDAFSQERN